MQWPGSVDTCIRGVWIMGAHTSAPHTLSICGWHSKWEVYTRHKCWLNLAFDYQVTCSTWNRNIFHKDRSEFSPKSRLQFFRNVTRKLKHNAVASIESTHIHIFSHVCSDLNSKLLSFYAFTPKSRKVSFAECIIPFSMRIESVRFRVVLKWVIIALPKDGNWFRCRWQKLFAVSIVFR